MSPERHRLLVNLAIAVAVVAFLLLGAVLYREDPVGCCGYRNPPAVPR